MYLNYLIIIVSIIMCGGVSSEMNTVEEMYLNFFVQIESVKKSIDILKVRLDAVSEKNPSDGGSFIDNKFQAQVIENLGAVKQYLDVLNTRLDPLTDNSKNKQQYVDKQSFDDLKTQLNSKIEKLESQQKILVQEISEMKGNYSNLLDELNTVTLSEKRFKEKYIDLEEKYLELVKNKETESKSNNDLNLRIDHITTQLSKFIASEAYDKKPLFDVRIDQLPEFKKEHCQPDSEPTDCKAATKCTHKSGYYKIYLPGNKAKQIMVFCDMEIAGGNWMHILRRFDGSENFTRPWSDYVNGFGNVEGEYWIGLQNLNALIKNNGRQLLYVHLESASGVSSYALYDNFLVGDATEIYKLKSLGTYDGSAVDGMSYYTGEKFSTIDYDNDSTESNCAKILKGGWWYDNCGYAQPTGLYGSAGVRWDSKESRVYNCKIMYFMIRSF
ncbi:angiopoietin-related protein 1-like [Calliphora vicina]|uniref:angiopoietin-related protein 1-like n=1 Tax=Calliphora vicina TaxID=7373 RepID=UPI00325BDB15